VAYEGEPNKIVDEGLLWNDPRSKCAITDPSLRDKVFAIATAWQEKNGEHVRSWLSDLKSSVPPSEAKPAVMHKPRRHKAASTGAAGAPNSNSAKPKTAKSKTSNSNSAKK
jgi:hypothetical protein